MKDSDGLLACLMEHFKVTGRNLPQVAPAAMDGAGADKGYAGHRAMGAIEPHVERPPAIGGGELPVFKSAEGSFFRNAVHGGGCNVRGQQQRTLGQLLECIFFFVFYSSDLKCHKKGFSYEQRSNSSP